MIISKLIAIIIIVSFLYSLFKEYRDCSVALLDKDQTCNKQDVKYFISLVEGNAADVFDLVCRSRKLDSNSKSKSNCIQVDDKEIRKSRRPMSLLPPYINIFSE